VRDFLLPVDVIIHPAFGEPVRVNLSGVSDLYLVSTFSVHFSIDKSIFQAKMLLDAQSLMLLVNKAKKMAKIKI